MCLVSTESTAIVTSAIPRASTSPKNNSNMQMQYGRGGILLSQLNTGHRALTTSTIRYSKSDDPSERHQTDSSAQRQSIESAVNTTKSGCTSCAHSMSNENGTNQQRNNQREPENRIRCDHRYRCAKKGKVVKIC